jgi:ABC-2 type transport system permease protein
MMNATHLRYEILRVYRFPMTVGLTMALPLVVYYAITPSNRHHLTEGITFPLYFMTAMAAYGVMWGAATPGARIARDRASGWTRQARTTPLRAGTYLASKVVTSYLVAIPTIGLLYLAGASLGVRLGATTWLEMTGLLLIGVTPFAVIGITLGHLATADAMVPAMAGSVLLFALLGGAFGRLFTGGAGLAIVKLLPSYWLVQAGASASTGGGDWPAEGWIVLAVWTAALVPLAVLVYRRDTSRA